MSDKLLPFIVSREIIESAIISTSKTPPVFDDIVTIHPDRINFIVKSDQSSNFNPMIDNKSLFKYLVEKAGSSQGLLVKCFTTSNLTQYDIDHCDAGSYVPFGTTGSGFSEWFLYRALDRRVYYICSSSYIRDIVTYQVCETTEKLCEEM